MTVRPTAAQFAEMTDAQFTDWWDAQVARVEADGDADEVEFVMIEMHVEFEARFA